MLLLAALLLCPASEASPFGRKTMHEDWPTTQVQRDFVLPRGWMQLGLSADSKSTSAYFDGQGRRTLWDNDTRYRYSRLWLRFDQGFSSRTRLYIHLPLVQVHLSNDLGADTGTTALGDAHAGVWIQPRIGEATAFAFRFDLKAPSGLEWTPGYVGGPDRVESFLTGTGCTNLSLSAHGRQKTEGLALDLSVLYALKIPAVVGYVVQVGGSAHGWLDPGDELRIDAGITSQLSDDLALGVEARLSAHGATLVGTSGPGVARLDLQPVPDTGGIFLSAGANLSWEPGERTEVRATGRYDLFGPSSLPFSHLGLEELSPQPGLTISAEGAVRW